MDNKPKSEKVVDDLKKGYINNENKKFSNKHKINQIANDAYEKYLKNKNK